MKLIALLSFALYSLCSCASEMWDLRMVLDVPRVMDNMASKGYRKYQKQSLQGYFIVERRSDDEPRIAFCHLENRTHKVNGRPVTYDVTVEDVKWHGIGSNATGKFSTRSVVLSIIAEPSYAIGEEPTNDNSLVVVLSGKGSETYLSGFVAGQLGCGCAEYGHVSPTRIWRTCEVVDIAAAYGKWKAKRW